MLAGRRLGVYQVEARLGAGGMGEVYRARDTKLGREVAIKVLPRAFTSDPERLARFEREARALAAVNHPNIGSIYGFEDSDGIHALVLELVDGETLAHRIVRGPLALREALAIAGQIAAALEAAHEKGIVTARRLTREVWKLPFGPDPLANGRRAVRLIDASLDPMWTHVTRDGKTLLFNNALVGSRNLWTMPLDRSAEPRQITAVLPGRLDRAPGRQGHLDRDLGPHGRRAPARR